MKHLRPAIAFTLFFIVLGGLLFPAVVYGLAQALFPNQANGSFVKDSKGNIVGSSLIAQGFTKPEYFHPRPSAAGNGYDAANSGATNLGPTSDKLINGVHDPKNPSNDFDGVKDLAVKYRAENGLAVDAQVPPDAVTRSASGLDPDISVENANLQAPRVAKARNLPEDKVKALISKHTSGGFLGLFGDPHVNVLELNLDLDHS
ncbi:MAG TPA: K(+)-transporting ATPase subunit C [Fimbriimonadaceae bacterium]|nr:K(+)-transporting ATPase subunit C [Fimbriimonadaceae bacterium]